MSKKYFLKRSYAEAVRGLNDQRDEIEEAKRRSVDPFEAEPVAGESVIPNSWYTGLVYHEKVSTLPEGCSTVR